MSAGWTCPVCGAGQAPWMDRCLCTQPRWDGEPRCSWIPDEDGHPMFLPHCYGGALEGPEGCTCSRAPGPRDMELRAARERATRAEARAERLRLDTHRRVKRWRRQTRLRLVMPRCGGSSGKGAPEG